MPRSRSWGFPRWGGYGSETQPQRTRVCDRDGCSKPGDHPAPKARHSDEKWWFCQDHAAEYNRSWNYFAGMSYDDMRKAAEEDGAAAAAYTTTSAYAQAAPAMSREERRAYATMDLGPEASADEIKTQYRRLAKLYHPDANPGDDVATAKFHELRQAYELVLRRQEVMSGQWGNGG